MSTYEKVLGLGDTISCDDCNDISENWYSDGTRAVCGGCVPISWGELAELTHATQVDRFNWCMCEEQELFPYDDCPRTGEIK
jgi:hypothetical protein